MAEQIESVWNKKHENKIDLVIGNEWYAGNFSYHLSSRPKWTRSTKHFPKNFKGGYLIITNEPLCLFSGFYPILEFTSQEDTNLYVCMDEIK